MNGKKSSARYLVPAALLLLNNEVVSLFALVVIAAVFIGDLISEAAGKA